MPHSLRTRAVIVGVGAFGLAAAPPAPAAGRKPTRPDLVATASKPPSNATAGDTISIRVALRNTGGTRTSATDLRLSLGSGRRYRSGDLVLKSVRRGAIAPGRRARPATVRVRLPLDGRASGRRRLLVCADSTGRVRERRESNNCAVAGTLSLPAVKASELIAVDGRAKRIDSDQAFALGVLVAAGEPRMLPARYRGALATGTDATGVITGAAARFGSLSAEAKRLLAPLFTPPGHVGSGRAPRGTATARVLRPPSPNACLSDSRRQVPDPAGWSSRIAPASKVVFWWPKTDRTGAASARALAGAMDGVIWPKLTKLMQRETKADDALNCPHGPSGGLDVYLVDTIGGREWNAPVNPGARGATTPYTCLTTPNASFIRLADKSVATLAHEYFHALQLSFADQHDCDRPAWLDEGTAEWAVEYVAPGSLKDTSAVWLNVFDVTLLERSYDAWPFWYSVAREAGADTIRAAYGNLATVGRVEAVDRGIGTFRARWPEFTRSAYNQPPITSYTAWTGTSARPALTSSLLTLAGGTTKTVAYTGSANLRPLSRDYEGFAFADDIRKITLAGLPTGQDYRLLALMRMRDGTWQERDVTKGVTLCRDRPEDDVEELVLAASNASVSGRLTAAPRLTVEDQCERPRFRVLSAAFSTHTRGSMPSGAPTQACRSAVTGVESYGGALGAPLDGPGFTLGRRTGGGLRGAVLFEVPADGSMSLEGCVHPFSAEEAACATTKSMRKDGGTDTIGFEIEVDPGRPRDARLRWSIRPAAVGYFDAEDSVCNVDEFYNFVGSDEQLTRVPLEQLEHGTHTFTNHGTRTWDADQKSGNAAAIALDWSYDITLQVIDADGNPVP